MPRLLGSQSCEKIFRAARSMTPTFSTVLNFGMLSLLQRLHRIHIQYCLENDTETSEMIKYPRKEVHKDKDGHDKQALCDPCAIKIIETVNKAKEDVKRTIENLGMYALLEKNNFKDPPIPYSEKKWGGGGDDDDDDDDIDDENVDNNSENDDKQQDDQQLVKVRTYGKVAVIKILIT